MNNKLVIPLALLMASSAPAMQRQKEQGQGQQHAQKKKDKKRQNHNNDGNTNPKEDSDPNVDTTDLNAMLAVIMNDINQAHGSVADMITHLKHKEHQRICPTCGRHAEICEADRDRIAHGNIMLCGCPMCGGLQI